MKYHKICNNTAVSCLFAYFLYHSLPRHPCCCIWNISWKLPRWDNERCKYILCFRYDLRLIWLLSAVDINRAWYLLENRRFSIDIWNSIRIPKHMKCQP